ncbi:AMP-binding protein, partial [Rothia sp. AR01]
PRARAARRRLTGPAPGTVPWRQLLGHPRIDAHHPRPGAHDLALLQYTSGTTGRPRGAMLTHRNLESNARMGEQWVQPGPDESIYAVLPLFHAYGMTLGLGIAIAIRARLVLFPTVDTDLLARAMKRSRPTILPAVPPVYRRLLEAAEERGVELRGIRYAVSGAMTLPRDLVAAWEERSEGFLVEGYGLTECAPLVACNPLNAARRTGSIGVPFPSTEIRLVDPGTGADAAAGEPGELWVRGPQTFRGYWGDEEATRAAYSADGWLRTGDLVRMDADGFLYVVDRLKEVIITGGFNVSPSEVEEALRDDDAVADAAVVGLPSPDGGEEVVAAVVTAPGAAFDERALRERCYAWLTRYKVPRRIVELERFPTSMLGKTLRREVRALLEEREG